MTIPPHTSIAVEYESDAIATEFDGDTEDFLDKGYEFQVMVKLLGIDGVRSVPARLERTNIRVLTDKGQKPETDWIMDLGD